MATAMVEGAGAAAGEAGREPSDLDLHRLDLRRLRRPPPPPFGWSPSSAKAEEGQGFPSARIRGLRAPRLPSPPHSTYDACSLLP